MQHLNEEQLVAHYYHDDDAPAAAEAHLASCPECRAQFETIRRVLTLVSDAPVPERGDAYAGGFFLRRPSACVPLVVAVGGRRKTVCCCLP